MVQFGLSCLDQEGQCACFQDGMRAFFRTLGLFMHKFDAVEYFWLHFLQKKRKQGAQL